MEIKNQYTGKTAEQVWNAWDEQQREHFMNDHNLSQNYNDTDWQLIMSGDFTDMEQPIREAIIEHVMEGQYKKGGTIYKKGGIIDKAISWLNEPLFK